MTKLAALAWAIIMMFAAVPQTEKFSKYKSVEAYEIRPGVLMMPRYAEDGQVCEIGLEARHYSPDKVRSDTGWSRKEIEAIVDELAPAAERGQETKGLAGGLTIDGVSAVTTSVYDNVTIQICSRIFPKTKIAADDVAVIIRWNHRMCQ